jgi:hypothetical protein
LKQDNQNTTETVYYNKIATPGNGLNVESVQNSIKWKIVCFVVLNVLLIGSTLFEQIRVNEGLGWDGIHYADLTRNFIQYMKEHSLNSYKVQRIFPCGIVFVLLRVLHLSDSNYNIVALFSAYNIILLNIALFFWFRILKIFAVPLKTVLVCTILLFFNFSIIKFSTFYPVLTDTTSFALGILLLYAYLRNRTIVVILLGLISAFTHPLLQYFSILLFLFPRENEKTEARSISILKFFPYIFSLLYITAIILLYVKRADLIDAHLFQNTYPVNRSLLFLSLLCTAYYLLQICKSLVKNQLVERVLVNLRPGRIVTALVILGGTFYLRKLLSSPAPAFGINSVTLNIMLQSISNPFVYLIAHVVFFGLAVILILLYFKHYEVEVSRLGLGFMACVYLILFFTIGSESRQFTFALPFLLLPIAIMFNAQFSARILPIVIFSALVFSKIWLPLNEGKYTGKPLQFPDQYLFMNMGPWMTWQVYLLQGGAALLLALIYFFNYYRTDGDPILSADRDLKINRHAKA